LFTIGGRAHTFDEIIEVCDLGYPYVEINFNDPNEIKSILNPLLDIKKKHNVYFLAHFPNEGDPADIDNLTNNFLPKIIKLIELCPQLGIDKATIHFWMDKRMEWASEEIITQKIKLLSTLVTHAKKFDVTLCLENLSCRYDSFERFFNDIPDLKMTMDIGHAQLLTKKNTCFGFMEHLFERIAHIHVHDNFGGNTVTDDLHLPLGEGIVDFPNIFSILRKKGYPSTMSMEAKPDKMKKTQTLIEQYIS